MLRIQEHAIMGGCEEVISPPKYSECFFDGGVLEPKVMQVHQNSISSKYNPSWASNQLEEFTKKLTKWSTKPMSIEWMIITLAHKPNWL